MMTPRLKAGLFVRAHIRICEVAGAYALVARKGDESAGSILIRITRLDGTGHLLGPVTQMDGTRAWQFKGGADPLEDAEIEALLAREIDRDPDLWVLEIEDSEGRHFLSDPIMA